MPCSAVWASDYLGIPFDAGGLTRAGCHCWGLVRMVLRERAQIEMPAYGEVDAAELVRVAHCMDQGVATWLPVLPTATRALDLVLMSGIVREHGRPRRAPVHCGIMVDEAHMLHVEIGSDAIVLPITHAAIAGRVLGLYRHRDLVA